MRSAKISLLLSAREKAAIKAAAAAVGISTSEWVRRAISAYRFEADQEALRALADELDAVVAATERKVDLALARLDACRERLADREALRAEGRAELEANGSRWPFDAFAGLGTEAIRRG